MPMAALSLLWTARNRNAGPLIEGVEKCRRAGFVRPYTWRLALLALGEPENEVAEVFEKLQIPPRKPDHNRCCRPKKEPPGNRLLENHLKPAFPIECTHSETISQTFERSSWR